MIFIKTRIIVCKEVYTCKYIAHIYIMHTGTPKCMKHAHMSSPALFELGGQGVQVHVLSISVWSYVHIVRPVYTSKHTLTTVPVVMNWNYIMVDCNVFDEYIFWFTSVTSVLKWMCWIADPHVNHWHQHSQESHISAKIFHKKTTTHPSQSENVGTLSRVHYILFPKYSPYYCIILPYISIYTKDFWVRLAFQDLVSPSSNRSTAAKTPGWSIRSNGGCHDFSCRWSKSTNLGQLQLGQGTFRYHEWTCFVEFLKCFRCDSTFERLF